MPTIALISEYDGTDFVGYQIQDNGRSVQQVLNEAVSEVYKTKINVTGCSRTDAGVHARGHVSSCEVPFYIPEDRIPLALNCLLPDDCSVKSAIYVKDGFNARFESLGKRYIYRIQPGRTRSPLLNRYAHYVKAEPDLALMQQAASLMAGEHDFASFCAAGGSQKTTVRRMFAVNVRKIPSTGIIEIEVQGEAFLYNMVRIMSGTILYAGLGKLTPDDIRELFEHPDRKNAGKTLPPEGLTLEEVYYDWSKWRKED